MEHIVKLDRKLDYKTIALSAALCGAASGLVAGCETDDAPKSTATATAEERLQWYVISRNFNEELGVSEVTADSNWTFEDRNNYRTASNMYAQLTEGAGDRLEITVRSETNPKQKAVYEIDEDNAEAQILASGRTFVVTLNGDDQLEYNGQVYSEDGLARALESQPEMANLDVEVKAVSKQNIDDSEAIATSQGKVFKGIGGMFKKMFSKISFGCKLSFPPVCSIGF
jgi:hypothetical protein